MLKYSNRQVSTTFGGPIKKDRAHFFGYWEGEREPQISIGSIADRVGPLPPFCPEGEGLPRG